MNAEDFRSLVCRARDGDEEAAAQLVSNYEPALKRQVRMFMTDPWLKRIVDTTDVVQSVLGNFFVRLAAGQFDLDEPGQLVKLLSTMALNRFRTHLRLGKAERGHESGKSADLAGAPATGDSPSRIVSNRELAQRVLELLTDEERAIADRRIQGSSWEEVASHLGGTAEGLRKKYARALNRVGEHLHLDALDM